MDRIRRMKKSKAAKDKENYEVTTFSDMTSPEVFYTTESSDTQRMYSYKKRHRKYDDQYTTNDSYDGSRTYSNYDSEYRPDDLYSYDDYTTSAISYDEKMRKPKERSYSQSKSEEIYSRKMSPRRHRISSTREYDYFSPDEREYKKRSKLTRELKNEFYRDIENDRRKKSHSPRRGEGYYNKENSYEDLNNNGRYKKYFEKTGSRKDSLHKHRNKKEMKGASHQSNKKIPHSLTNAKDYQVFAYQDVDPHEIFKGEQNVNGGTLLASEIEVRTHEYPVLAFKDPTAVDKGSDMVYLPIILVDKKLEKSSDFSNVPTTNVSTGLGTQQGNYQIFAANLNDQKNIFQNYDKVSNQIPSTSSNREGIVNQQTEKLQNPEGEPETTSGIRYAASLLEAIFDQSQFSPQSTREQLPETKGSQQTKGSLIDTFKTNKNSLTYQVNIDIVPSFSDVLQQNPSGNEPTNKSDQMRYTQIHDDYPVVKDYIKVNENTMEEQRSIIPKKNLVINRVSMSPAHQGSLNEQTNTQRNREASNIMSSRMSTLRRQDSEVKNNTIVEKVPSNLQRSLVIQSKPGSMAIASNLQQKELNLKNVPASMRLSTVREGVPQNSSVRRLTVTPTSMEPTVDRRSRKDSAVMSRAASIAQGPRALSKTSGSPQRISETNKQSMVRSPEPQRASERKIQSVIKSISPYSESVVAQGSTDVNRTSVIAQRASKANKQSITGSPSLARQQSKGTIIGVAPSSDIGKTGSTDALNEFTKKIFPEIENKTSAVLSVHPTKSKQSIVDMKSKTSMTTPKSIVGTKQSVVEKEEEFRKESRISFAPQVIEQEESKKASVRSGIMPTTQKDAFESGRGSTLQEKIVSVTNMELSDQRPKSKISFKGLASALVNLGKSSKSSLASTKPYIKVMPESPTTRMSAMKAQDDNGSLFVRSIEPTSTLYKKEQQIGQSQNRSSRSVDDESKKKSKTKLPTVKEKKSKKGFFSKSKSKINLTSEGSNMSPMSKKKSVWGILRRTKSKDSSSSLTYQQDVPMEGPVLQEGPDFPSSEDEKRLPTLQEKSCKCLTESFINARTYAYFFLGTNLYQQIMNILTEF